VKIAFTKLPKMLIQACSFKNFLAAENMRVYHGSDVLVEMPRIVQPVRALDFGLGFYLSFAGELKK
jgi:hypothetical protein